MTDLCNSPHPDEPGVVCVGPPGHRVTNTMHGNGDLRWWDGPSEDAGAEGEGVAYASPALGWLDGLRERQVVVEHEAGHKIGTLGRVLVEPDQDNVLHPSALVVTHDDGRAMLVPWHAVVAVYEFRG